MIYDPLRSLVEQAGARVNEHLLVVADSLVAFSWVFAATVVEETRADGLSDLRIVLQL